MENHIEEYFNAVEQNSQLRSSKELFNIKDETELDFKTEVNETELRIVTNLFVMDKYLLSIGMPPIFNDYYTKFLRLVVSKDRKSREEFISINKSNNDDETISKLSDFSNIVGSKE